MRSQRTVRERSEYSMTVLSTGSARVVIRRDTKCFSNWFGMTWYGLGTDSGMARNSSDSLGMNFNPILLPGNYTTEISESFGLEFNPTESEIF